MHRFVRLGLLLLLYGIQLGATAENAKQDEVSAGALCDKAARMQRFLILYNRDIPAPAAIQAVKSEAVIPDGCGIASELFLTNDHAELRKVIAENEKQNPKPRTIGESPVTTEKGKPGIFIDPQKFPYYRKEDPAKNPGTMRRDPSFFKLKSEPKSEPGVLRTFPSLRKNVQSSGAASIAQIILDGYLTSVSG